MTGSARFALLFIMFAAGNGWASQKHPGSRCPSDAVHIIPGASIQDEVEKAGENAKLCLKQGIHRQQAVRPLAGQSFYGERGSVMNGARLLTDFKKDGRYWTADVGEVSERRHGQCAEGHDNCNLPVTLFMGGDPLQRTMQLDDLIPGRWFLDREGGRVFIDQDPQGRVVELSLTPFAFQSKAASVLISGLTVEKYASPAQRGAIDGKDASDWTVENCDVRVNSGAGISIGPGGRIVSSDIYRNGQIGAVMVGARLLLRDNIIRENNRLNFDFTWEAGGVKIAASDGVLVSGNFVYHNNGPGLWCDIDCRNVVFENNRVEYNADAGIFHEISYRAVIRNNVVAFNGSARPWYWGADIQIAASENVDVYENNVTTRPGGNSIMLIDQSRAKAGGGKHRTIGNFIYNNTINFSGASHVGGASDAPPDDENFAIIEKGGNRFNNNIYKGRDSASKVLFVWGHDVHDWGQFRQLGQETGASLSYD